MAQACGTDGIAAWIAGGVGSHVGNHGVERTTAKILSGQIAQVRLNQAHIRRISVGVDRLEVDGNDLAARTNASGGHLRPTARRGTRVQHPITSAQQTLAIIDVDELVGRARAIAFFLRETKPVVLDFLHRRNVAHAKA